MCIEYSSSCRSENERAVYQPVQIYILYGLSAIGTSLCFYTWTKKAARHELRTIPIDQDILINTAPTNRWNLDILTPGGEEKFRQVVAHIKMMCRRHNRVVNASSVS